MNPQEAPIHIDTLLALLLVASATAVVIKWVKVPYAVALVIAGLMIGLSKVLPAVSMTPELVLLIFLPALLFEAAWNLDIKVLHREWFSITVLATGGVVVCMFGVAAILHFVGGMSAQTALLFGAMVSATDPVSVIALFRQMGIDNRLTMILEGESIFNDGTAVVLFKIVLALLISGTQFSLVGTIGSFCFVVLGGATLGLLFGFAASRITSAFDDHLLEITLTMVTAYGSYLAAEQLHVSSIIAVVAAGIVLGNYGSRTGMSVTTRLYVNSFWEYAAFLVNSLLFLLIGLQVQLSLLQKYSYVIGLGVLAVFAARLLVVYGICPFVSTASLPIPSKWRHLMFWGGLRGALVMALALSLPLNFPDREAIINMTFGVVLFTLLVPGLTMEPLVRFLGMAPPDKAATADPEHAASIKIIHSELRTLAELRKHGKISDGAHETWKARLESELTLARNKSDSWRLLPNPSDDERDRKAISHLLESRKTSIDQLVKEGVLNADSALHLKMSVDSELNAILTDRFSTESSSSS